MATTILESMTSNHKHEVNMGAMDMDDDDSRGSLNEHLGKTGFRENGASGTNMSIGPPSPHEEQECSYEETNERTINASNVSNLGLQLAGHKTVQEPCPGGGANPSLREMFPAPRENARKTSNLSSTEEGDEFFSKEELWDYDDTAHHSNPSSLHSVSKSDNEAPQESIPSAPPDSLHHPPVVASKHSKVVALSREGPRVYQAAQATAPPASISANLDQHLAAQMYSSDSSSDSRQWSSSSRKRQPVLYSAIGSLEDPSNSSFKWKKRSQPVLYSAIGSLEDPGNSSFKWKKKNQIQKYEFPSSSRTLLAPKKTYTITTNVAVSGEAVTAAPTEAITTFEPRLKPDEPETQPQDKNWGSSSTSEPKEASDDILPSQTTASQDAPLRRPSNLKSKKDKEESGGTVVASAKKVSISDSTKSGKPKKTVEMFRPSSDAYTPRMGKKDIKFKPAEQRTPVQKMASGMGTLSRPNFRDALRRVAMIIHQHIVKIEQRFEAKQNHHPIHMSPHSTSSIKRSKSDKLFTPSMKEEFSEDRFITPTYKCAMVRIPMARPGMVYGLKQIRHKYQIPTEREIYEFAHRLFKTVQLSSECSIVCLIYVERLMEEGKVPLMASTWRPIVMTGLLLASKVWQDLSSWNIEFTNVYPQYSLEAIHRLEVKFLRILKWDLYISSSLYAKYYFALRSLVEKQDFRQRYNRLCGVDNVEVKEALKVEERSTLVKEEALMQLSRSM